MTNQGNYHPQGGSQYSQGGGQYYQQGYGYGTGQPPPGNNGGGNSGCLKYGAIIAAIFVGIISLIFITIAIFAIAAGDDGESYEGGDVDVTQEDGGTGINGSSDGGDKKAKNSVSSSVKPTKDKSQNSSIKSSHSSKSSDKKWSIESGNTKKTSKRAKPIDKKYQMGDKARLDNGLNIYVSNPKKKKDVFKQWVYCVSVKYENTSDNDVSYSGVRDWNIQTPSGAASMPYIGEKILESGTLVPGGKVSGRICKEYEHPEPGVYKFIYTDNSIFSRSKATWDAKF